MLLRYRLHELHKSRQKQLEHGGEVKQLEDHCIERVPRKSKVVSKEVNYLIKVVARVWRLLAFQNASKPRARPDFGTVHNRRYYLNLNGAR